MTSPNWDEGDQGHRGWKGRNEKGTECFFKIEDAEFWRRVKSKEIAFRDGDSMIVQWSFEKSGRGGKDYRVHRVLRYNDKRLADPLSGSALAALLGEFLEWNTFRSRTEDAAAQGDLFNN